MQKETSSNSSKKQNSAWTQTKVGAFWIKNKSDGRSYLSGNIEINGEKVSCLIFKNDYQEGNTPHFHAYSISKLVDCQMEAVEEESQSKPSKQE